ncbi:MerR family transcriptional regulator [Saezia sanguinis]|jgi:DNA-binding transcriptional MerR regulator|nr:MerR family transcriptional regulator [Saezia sanguinis]
MMRIKELAQAVGTPVETIRYYERSGLLPQAQRSENNYRVYSKADEDRLRFIRNCRALDMNLDEIRELITFIDHAEQHGGEHEDCSGIRAIVADHLNHVRERLLHLKMLKRQMEHLLAACDQPEPAVACNMVRQLFSEMGELTQSGAGHGVHTS